MYKTVIANRVKQIKWEKKTNSMIALQLEDMAFFSFQESKANMKIFTLQIGVMPWSF